MPSLRCSDADLGAHLGAELRVEVGQGLVHQAHRRARDDGAAQRHALLLAAGELRRLAVEQAREPEQVGDLRQPRVAFRLRHLAHLQPEQDVLRDRQVREQRIRLEDHRDRSLRGGQPRHVASGDADRAGIGELQAGDQAQRGGLAAARGAEQHVERAFLGLEGDAVHPLDPALRGGPVLGDVGKRDGGHVGRAVASRGNRGRRARSRGTRPGSSAGASRG